MWLLTVLQVDFLTLHISLRVNLSKRISVAQRDEIHVVRISLCLALIKSQIKYFRCCIDDAPACVFWTCNQSCVYLSMWCTCLPSSVLDESFSSSSFLLSFLPSFVCCLLLLRHISPFSFSSSSSREAEWIIHAGGNIYPCLKRLPVFNNSYSSIFFSRARSRRENPFFYLALNHMRLRSAPCCCHLIRT